VWIVGTSELRGPSWLTCEIGTYTLTTVSRELVVRERDSHAQGETFAKFLEINVKYVSSGTD
jgi:hypothetical protein